MAAGSALLRVCVVIAAAAAVGRAVGPDLKARARDEDALRRSGVVSFT